MERDYSVPEGQISIAGLDKAEVLAALYNGSRPLGMGFLNPKAGVDMTTDEARKIIADGHLHFDYLQGRVMKLSIDEDTLHTRLYNRDNGHGAAERVIEGLRASKAA